MPPGLSIDPSVTPNAQLSHGDFHDVVTRVPEAMVMCRRSAGGAL